MDGKMEDGWLSRRWVENWCRGGLCTTRHDHPPQELSKYRSRSSMGEANDSER